MQELSPAWVHERVLQAVFKPASAVYYCALAILLVFLTWALLSWFYQIFAGMGVAGINHPIGWGVYIVDFVFWVGIAHSGTLISAILYLVRAEWRNSIARAAEAMTVFAVMTAGLFPLIHLGRLWVFYYILPYPSTRQLWPNFQSPLVLDVMAISTYLTVSVIFFYVGLIPDLASARDEAAQKLGYDHWRTRLFSFLSLGWNFSLQQWRHYSRSYLFFAALATPLVVSVHSVVSWDFALSILPGWHSTIFAPYFVAGAIHSGLAMVVTLVIILRKVFRLERIITAEHFNALAKTMLVTTGIMGYSYLVEVGLAWYSGDPYEKELQLYRIIGPLAPIYWSLILFNVLVPGLFVFKRIRQNLTAAFMISIGVNIGMYLERYLIITSSTAHDFLPHNWGTYFPTWVELSITAGSFAFFLLWFLGFAKFLPTVPVAEFNEGLWNRIRSFALKPSSIEIAASGHGARFVRGTQDIWQSRVYRVTAIFPDINKLYVALNKITQDGFSCRSIYSPIRPSGALRAVKWGPSPVRYWTLTGALLGMMSGFALAIYSAKVNAIIVGGKPAVAIIPYCVVAFEGTVLLGALGNLGGLVWHARLPNWRSLVDQSYSPSFSRDKFGLAIEVEEAKLARLESALAGLNAEEIKVANSNDQKATT